MKAWRLRLVGLMVSALGGIYLPAAFSSRAFAALSERVLFNDAYDQEGAPYWWQPLLGEWTYAQRATRVLRQSSEDITSDSWNIVSWANYTVVAKCLGEEGEGLWGVGVTAYDDTRGSYYRLRLGEGRLYLEKVKRGEVRGIGSVEAKIVRGKWFSLRLALTTRPESTILLGKVWAGDEEEPKEWQIRTEDNSEPYTGGTIGLWTGNCAGRCLYLSARHYDLAADKIGAPLYSTDFSEVPQGRLPTFWRARGGLWLRDTQPDKQAVLRQILDSPGPLYDENASACLRWTGYTVSVRAIAHPGTTRWGFGVIGYFNFADGSNYRLRTLDNRVYLVKRRADGRVDNLANTTIPIQRGRWYNLKLALDNLREGVRLQGKVWLEEAPEPEQWQLTAYDRTGWLTDGAPGLWCFGSAVDFDDFQVRTSTLSALNDLLQ